MAGAEGQTGGQLSQPQEQGDQKSSVMDILFVVSLQAQLNGDSPQQ